MNRQKELEVDPKVIKHMEFVEQLKKIDNNCNTTDASNDQSMFVLRILEKKIEEMKGPNVRGLQENCRVPAEDSQGTNKKMII